VNGIKETPNSLVFKLYYFCGKKSGMRWEAYAACMGIENAWRIVVCNIDGREVCVLETTTCKEITLRCILFKPFF
jgi:hypothetical protein